MVCDLIRVKDLPPRKQSAVERLEAALAIGTAALSIDRQGLPSFTGWTDKQGLCDVCVYRSLTASNSPGLRRAKVRAELLAGRKVDQRAVMTA